jgi:hypothetical protein
MKNSYKVLVGNRNRRKDVEDVDIDGRTISEWILEKQNV